MEEHKEYAVAEWAGFFRVSRSGYYSSSIAGKKRREQKEAGMKSEMLRIFEGAAEHTGRDGYAGCCGRMTRKVHTVR